MSGIIQGPVWPNFERFAFPIIRSVFPQLIAEELVSVQPMSMIESGYAFSPYIPIQVTDKTYAS